MQATRYHSKTCFHVFMFSSASLVVCVQVRNKCRQQRQQQNLQRSRFGPTWVISLKTGNSGATAKAFSAGAVWILYFNLI